MDKEEKDKRRTMKITIKTRTRTRKRTRTEMEMATKSVNLLDKGSEAREREGAIRVGDDGGADLDHNSLGVA